ncbi:unnamed protein product [Ceratitis capitata]|uniref:(Mediterranean fruit fly) hypothetical protein n=1 Tax=Ceratitis capitata TaxID=7213 RepID=A0A811US82_CERCA|nr:unnamed protein product [Ceratitis capitata]
MLHYIGPAWVVAIVVKYVGVFADMLAGLSSNPCVQTFISSFKTFLLMESFSDESVMMASTSLHYPNIVPPGIFTGDLKSFNTLTGMRPFFSVLAWVLPISISGVESCVASTTHNLLASKSPLIFAHTTASDFGVISSLPSKITCLLLCVEL